MDELDVHGGQDDYSDEDVVHDIKKRASRKKVRLELFTRGSN